MKSLGKFVPIVLWATLPVAFFVLGQIHWQPPHLCLWSHLLGVRCPGCGMTHAALALCRGDWAGAMAKNVLSPVVMPLVAVLYVRWGWGMLRPHTRGDAYQASPIASCPKKNPPQSEPSS